jgi:hypothetical protein
MRQLHRLEMPVDDQGRAEARAEAEEEHAPALVAAERLHRRVVQDAHRLAEGLAEIESHPAPAEVPGLGDRLAVQHRAGIADRDDVVAPVRGELLDRGDHAPRRQLGARRNLARLALPGREHLHVRAADVDDEDLHRRPQHRRGAAFPLGERTARVDSQPLRWRGSCGS